MVSMVENRMPLGLTLEIRIWFACFAVMVPPMGEESGGGGSGVWCRNTGKTEGGIVITEGCQGADPVGRDEVSIGAFHDHLGITG